MTTKQIFMNVVYEDALSFAVIERLLAFSRKPIVIQRKLGGTGCGYILSRIKDFQTASHHQPFFILVDSDQEGCALRLLNNLVSPHRRHRNLLLRIAVREVESWLLADAYHTSRFLGVHERLVHQNPESLVDAKGHLMDLARRSKKRQIREGLLPDPRTSAIIGPEYNQMLSAFVKDKWDATLATRRSESLRRALAAIRAL